MFIIKSDFSNLKKIIHINLIKKILKNIHETSNFFFYFFLQLLSSKFLANSKITKQIQLFIQSIQDIFNYNSTDEDQNSSSIFTIVKLTSVSYFLFFSSRFSLLYFVSIAISIISQSTFEYGINVVEPVMSACTGMGILTRLTTGHETSNVFF